VFIFALHFLVIQAFYQLIHRPSIGTIISDSFKESLTPAIILGRGNDYNRKDPTDIACRVYLREKVKLN